MLLLFTVLACPASTTTAATTATTPVAPAAPTEAAAATPDAADAFFVGIIQENLPGGSYTYSRVKAADGAEAWAAYPGAAVAPGTKVAVVTSLPMADFHSNVLNRDFPMVYFVESLGAGAVSVAPTTPGAEALHATGAEPDAAATATLRVEQLWLERSTLAGNRVSVDAEVVKFTGGVMGRNWVHVRDGTGTPGTDDVTVTTGDIAAIGDRVRVTGTVQVDQDYGHGYTYALILTDGTVRAR